MADNGTVGIGLLGPHPTIANLWVREIDPTHSDLMLTGICTVNPVNNFTQSGVFSHGCTLVWVTGTGGAQDIFVNTGTSASPVWNDIVATTTSTSSSSSSSSSTSSSSSSSS
jgi:hypothetical protein